MFPYELTVFTYAWFHCELLGAVECRERQGWIKRILHYARICECGIF